MRTCAAETDPDKWQRFWYITAEYFENHRHYYESIVGWEWTLYSHPMGSVPQRFLIYALLDDPVLACLWRIEMPRSGSPEYKLEFESCSTVS